MSTGQIHGAGAVLLSVLAAALLSGVVRHYAVPVGGAQSAQARHVLAAGPPTRRLTIPAGFRLEQVASIVGNALGTSGGDFLALAASPHEARRRGVDAQTLEGFLAPGTYTVRLDRTERDLLDTMVARFQSGFTPRMLLRARELRLSVHEVVTLASIVQRESFYSSDMPVIAAVFLNRLRAGMPLQADPPLQYALDSARGVPDATRYWTTRLLRADVSFPSPYNDYRHRGLPPGPIASPSLQALDAVLYAADVPYLYFVGKTNGASAFATTLAGHERNIARYRRGSRLPPGGGPGLGGLLRRLAEPIGAHAAIVVENLRTGEAASVNADDFFTSASLYKLFVMDAAFERRARGLLRFDRPLPIAQAAARLDPPAVRTRLGTRPTVAQAIRDMITVSSNAAGVTLLRELGEPVVTRVIRRQGLHSTFLNESGFITTPRDVARLLELIARGRAVSARASAAMRTILLRQELNSGLPRFLPRGTPVAHKTGSLPYVSHDAGIIQTRSGPILVVVMTEGVRDPVAATRAIARLAQFVVYYFERYRPAAHRLGARETSACPGNPFRPRRAGPLSGKTIVLDPGHGGSRAPGGVFTFPDGFVLTEKAVVLDVSSKLKDLLTASGANVYMTRCRDAPLTLIERAAYANSVGADLFVSVHVNSSAIPAKDGTELYYLSRAGHAAANYMLGSFTIPALWQTLSTGLALPNRGILRRELDVLVYTHVPAVLTESLFLSNPAEAAAVRPATGARRRQIVLGHLRGIRAYFTAENTRANERRERHAPRRPQPAAAAHAAQRAVGRLSPLQKAALLVVSALPAPNGIGSVLLSSSTRHRLRPRGALVFADQEGRSNRALPALPPNRDAAAYATTVEAFAAGVQTGRALRRARVHVDLAPALDSNDGPLGRRHFADPVFGVAFARGLAAQGVASCAKHFPGLGSTLVSTDIAQSYGVVRPRELAGFEDAVRAGVPCVMVSSAIYPALGPRAASLERATYRLLRQGGFAGIALTDDLSVIGGSPADSARAAIEAGADLVLFTNPDDAKAAVAALAPLAQKGLLDRHVGRVLRFRRAFLR